MEDHATASVSEEASAEFVVDGTPDHCEMQTFLPDGREECPQPPAEASPARSPAGRPDAFTDDEILPVFEADLDLPHMPVAGVIAAKNTSRLEESQ
jgi:hypothetical protein